MRLDEIEKLARDLAEYGVSADASKAAEMVLVLLPVVRAADVWVSADEGEDAVEGDRLTCAVVQMRARLDGAE